MTEPLSFTGLLAILVLVCIMALVAALVLVPIMLLVPDKELNSDYSMHDPVRKFAFGALIVEGGIASLLLYFPEILSYIRTVTKDFVHILNAFGLQYEQFYVPPILLAVGILVLIKSRFWEDEEVSC